MDITKLLPLLMMANNGGGSQGNINQILPELLKTQTGDQGGQNALTGMLLNMLTSNFNKQNNSGQTPQNNQSETQKNEFNTPNNPQNQNNETTLKNYKNFYSPPEYNAAQVQTQSKEQFRGQSCQLNTNPQNVYPTTEQPTESKKNSVDTNATNVTTPFGYTRLY